VTLPLAAAATLCVLYAGLCKALLFRNLEYFETDLFGFLEMSWSWHYAGRLLHDNAYGDHFAIHNYYLLPLLSPLTMPFGAHGLIGVLVVLHLAAVLRIVRAEALDLPGRLAALAGLLGPIAYYVFDNPVWGFHPEILYPPLVALLAIELLEGRRGPAIAVVLVIVLVKEDGAVLVAAVLVAYFAHRLWSLRAGDREERRRVVRAALLSVLAVTLVFLAGMAVLSVASQSLAPTQTGSSPRLSKALRILAATLTGDARSLQRTRLFEGLLAYAGTIALVLLPLGRRLPRGLMLAGLSAPPVIVVLAVSSAIYRFELMAWPPRLALLVGLVVACSVFARSVPTRPASARTAAGVVLLVAASWGLQILLLRQIGYSPWTRLDTMALLRADGYRASAVPPGELAFLRCIAGRLPGGLPVSAPRRVIPVFHRQSVVFEELMVHAWHPPRLRVVSSTGAAAEGAGCRGPQAGSLAVEAECSLLPLVRGCGRDASPGDWEVQSGSAIRPRR
jgi:putative flippase GtrA